MAGPGVATLVMLVVTPFIQGVAVRGLQVKAPRVAFVGDDVELECQVQWPAPLNLYSIKWWKGNHQFYQYIPKQREPKMQFNVTGMKVDAVASGQFSVVLREVGVASSGTFTCEVIFDETFETFRQAVNMTIIDPPDHNRVGVPGPSIEVAGWGGTGPYEVADGQVVEAVCVARGADPPVNLTWYFNDTQVAAQAGSSWRDGPTTHTTSSRLVFVADQRWDSQGQLVLRCTAEVPGLFQESALLHLHNPALRHAHLSGLFAHGCVVGVSPRLVLMCAVLSLLLPWTPWTTRTPFAPHLL